MGHQEISFRVLQKKVCEYAQKNRFLRDLGELDSQLKIDFLLLLSTRNLVPKRTPIHVDETILSNINLFFDWHLFEREYEDGKTIAELYIESEEFKEEFGTLQTDLREDLKNLRKPLCNVFIVIEKKERDEYLVQPLEREETLLIHDKTSFPQVKVGEALYGVLYKFGARCYIGGRGLVRIPEKVVKRYYKTKSLVGLLEKKFDEFMETKSHLSERTLRKKEEMFYCLLDYVKEKSYTKIDNIKKMNVDTWMKWTRRRYLDFSTWREEEYRRGFRQFYKYLCKNPPY